MEEKKTPKLVNYKQGISMYFMLREAKDMRRGLKKVGGRYLRSDLMILDIF